MLESFTFEDKKNKTIIKVDNSGIHFEDEDKKYPSVNYTIINKVKLENNNLQISYFDSVAKQSVSFQLVRNDLDVPNNTDADDIMAKICNFIMTKKKRRETTKRRTRIE